MSEAAGYHYVECGLPNVWLLNGYDIVESPYGEGVSIRDLDGLHRCLARCLCDKPTSLTGAEFRYLRRELDFSQTTMGELLGIDARQIRNVERPAAPVRELYDRLIRHMYMSTIDPRNSFLALVDRLKSLDIEWHNELKLSKGADEGSWSSNIRDAA